jgi:uncharacterized alpha-E superfamily protein
MLGKTANAIFWMFRYLERAENTARLLEAGFRMALTRGGDAAGEEWRSVINTLGMEAGYDAKYDGYSGPEVCDYILRDKDNPESVMAMVENARSNARLSRTSITSEVWEAVNEAWMSLKAHMSRQVREANLSEVLYSIRREATQVRGATYGSMLRNDIFHFARAGTFVERADNTSRILDVKYHLLLPSLAHVGSRLDAGQWESILRALSARRAHREVIHSGKPDASGIAELLILDPRFPRSLAYCYESLSQNLSALAVTHGQEGQCTVLMQEARSKLFSTSIEDIFDRGLHEFLVDFISGNRAIANAIAEDYRFTH